MISKNISLVLLSAILVLSLVSAVSVDQSSLTFSGLNQSKTLQVTNNFNGTDSITISPSSPSVAGVNFVLSKNSFPLGYQNSTTFTVAVGSFPTDLKFGTYSTTLVASGSNPSDTSASTTLNFIKSFCKNGNAGTNNLSIRNIDINNEGPSGDDNDWDLLDTITVEVKVENIGDDDIDDIQVELGLIDSDGKNLIGDVDFSTTDEEKVDLGDLSDGDDDTANFEFRIPADMNTGSYSLVVKAYSKKSNEANVCVDESDDLSDNFFEKVSVNEESDKGKFIAFDNIKLNPTDITCGDSVTLDLDVYNVGEDNEDRIKVNLENSELGLSQSFEIKNGLDQSDNEKISFSFKVPSDAADKTYQLALSSDYDYRSGNYRQDSDDDTLVPLKVFGCSVSGSTNRIASISASLDSDAKAGEEMTISATVRNTQNSTATFSIDATGFDSWATLGSISDRTLNLAPGESSDVTINLNVKNDATGTKSFVIQASSNGKVESKAVEVTLSESGSSLSGLFSGNSLVWVIGLVNLVLIILIIFVAVRLSRK